MPLPLIDIPHILSVGDVLPLEGVNEAVTIFQDSADWTDVQHRSVSARSGEHVGPPTLAGVGLVRGFSREEGVDTLDAPILRHIILEDWDFKKVGAIKYWRLTVRPDLRWMNFAGIQGVTSYGGAAVPDWARRVRITGTNNGFRQFHVWLGPEAEMLEVKQLWLGVVGQEVR